MNSAVLPEEWGKEVEQGMTKTVVAVGARGKKMKVIIDKSDWGKLKDMALPASSRARRPRARHVDIVKTHALRCPNLRPFLRPTGAGAQHREDAGTSLHQETDGGLAVSLV